MWKIRIFWKENGSPASTGGFHLDPGSNSHGHFVSNVIVRRCEQYYFVSEKDLTKCEQLEWIPSFHWWFPSCSWSQFPRTARDRRTCKELTGLNSTLKWLLSKPKVLRAEKKWPVLRFNFCSEGTLCPVHLQDHCLQVLTWSSENILCRNILFSYSPPQTKTPLCFFWCTYTCLNQVSIKVKSGATVQVNTWTTTWLPSLPRHLPQQLHLLNSLHLIIQVFISDWKNGWMFCLFLIIDLSFARDCEI